MVALQSIPLRKRLLEALEEASKVNYDDITEDPVHNINETKRRRRGEVSSRQPKVRFFDGAPKTVQFNNYEGATTEEERERIRSSLWYTVGSLFCLMCMRELSK